MTTTIVKWGNSRGIRLPKPFLASLDLKDNDVVDIITDNDKIIIKKSNKYKHKSIKQRIEEFYGTDFDTAIKENHYEYEEIDSGDPIGEEIW